VMGVTNWCRQTSRNRKWVCDVELIGKANANRVELAYRCEMQIAHARGEIPASGAKMYCWPKHRVEIVVMRGGAGGWKRSRCISALSVTYESRLVRRNTSSVTMAPSRIAGFLNCPGKGWKHCLGTGIELDAGISPEKPSEDSAFELGQAG